MKTPICHWLLYLLLISKIPSLAQSIPAQRRIDSLIRLYEQATLDTSKISLLQELAFEHYAKTDYEKAEMYITTQRKLLNELAEDKYKIWKNNQLADSYTLEGAIILEKNGDYEAVFQKYKQARVLLEKYPESQQSIYMSNLFSNMGYTYSRQGKYTLALDYQLKTIQIDTLLKPIHKMYNSHLTEIGDLYNATGNREQSLVYYFKGLESAQKMQDTRYVYLNYARIGDTYSALNRYEEAIRYTQLAIASANNFQRKLDAARFKAQLAGIYFLQKEYKNAISLFSHALKAYKNLNIVNSISIAGIMNRLGRVYQKTGKYDSSLYYHSEALTMQIKMKYHEGMPLTFLNLGELYQTQKQYEKAKKYYQIALDSSIKKHHIDNIQRAYLSLSQVSESLGDFKSALAYHKSISSLKDSLTKAQNANKLAEMQVRFETQAKEAQIKQLSIENELKEQEIKENKLWFLLMMSLFTSIFIFSFLIYRYRFRYQKKMKEMEKRHEIQLERERIAKDLHDNIGSQISLISRKLDQLLAKDENDEKMIDLSDSAHEVLNQLRQTLWAINKETIKISELADKIENLTYQYQKLQNGVKISFEKSLSLDQNWELSNLEGLNFFRIAQEALHNALKHSQADEIKVMFFSQKTNNLLLKIEDNGIGFMIDNYSIRPENYGLNNMKQRAERIGAKITLSSNLGKGTSIMISK
jgi:signal transduction histidine kinase